MYKILISHRGNINGRVPELENTQDFIQKAIDVGYDVEVDVWIKEGNLYLGHDSPDYRVPYIWLMDRADNLWVHAKNFSALDGMLRLGVRVFYHQYERHTVIGNTTHIWSHDLTEANISSIIPLLSIDDINAYDDRDVHGICSDFVSLLRDGK